MAYELIDLGANVEPASLSNTLEVVGAYNTDQQPAVAFRWNATDGFTSIDGTVANSVNDNGQVAGNTVGGAFIEDGSYREWTDYAAFGNNQSGLVAGYQVGDNPYRATSLPFNPAVFDGRRWQVYDIAQLYARGTRKGVYADRFILYAINEAGIAVGYKYRYGLSGSSAISIDTNGAINSAADVDFLPIPNGGRATAINSMDQIVGTSGNNSSAGEYAFAFRYDLASGDLLNLGTLPSNGVGSEPGLSSAANDINDAGQVVGNSWLVTSLTSLVDPSKYHAFLWQDGAMTDLNDLVQLPQGWILTNATAINEAGDITGIALVNDTEHGFLLLNGGTINPPPAGNSPPVAVATAEPVSGKAPLTVTFTGSGSYDPDGSIASYSWDFNDGASSLDPDPVHTFTERGTYLVTLTVTDNGGKSTNGSVTVVVGKGRGKK